MQVKRMLAAILLSVATVVTGYAEVVRVTVDAAALSDGSWRTRVAAADSVEVTVAESVTAIPDAAFEDCVSLVRVVFPAQSKVRSVGRYAFLGCERLERIELPARLNNIGEEAFRECRCLVEVSLPEGVITLPARLFQWCDSLRSVTLPSQLKIIKAGAFQYCRSLERIELPSTVREIGSNAFAYCSSLTEIEFPGAVQSLGSYVMSECTSLQRAVLPSNSAMLGELMFSGCRSLTEIVEMSSIPPAFDCSSYIFEPDETELYDRCVLKVKAASVDKYRSAHGWNMFTHIEE